MVLNALSDAARDARYYSLLTSRAPGRFNPDGALAGIAPVIYTFLMQLCGDLESGRLTQSEYDRCVKIFESYSVRRAVCDGDIRNTLVYTLINHWCEAMTDEGAPGADWLANELRRHITPASRWPDAEEFRAAIQKRRGANSKIAEYFFKTLERSLGASDADLEGAVLEAVVPKDATADSPEFWRSYGNLVLVPRKERREAESFAKKRERFAKSPFEGTRLAAEYADWGEEEIAARAEFLADRALEIWTRPGDGREETR
ncbi:MAG: HNH endonuclease [Thermoguttaceae bacterium]|nr:HNH endonuclease [Thermoguttaceae bacterium]